MARWKREGDGFRYDPNDNGPDQGTPEEIAAWQNSQGGGGTPAAPAAPAVDAPRGPQMGDPNGYYVEGASPQSVYDAEVRNMQATGSPTIDAAPLPTPPPTPAPSSGYGPVPLGFDSGKWNDPNHTTPKYVAGRIYAQTRSVEAVAQALGATVLSADKIRMPDGSIVDIAMDVEGANQPWWNPETGPGGAPLTPEASSTPAPQTPRTPSAGYSTPGMPAGESTALAGSSSATSDSPLNTLLQSLILEEMGRARNFDPNDPRIQNQVNAFRNEQERSIRSARSSLAERAAYAGLPSGSVDASILGNIEKAGINTGNFSAGLIGEEYDKQRQFYLSLLNAAIQMGDTSSARQLQLLISQMDNSYRNRALDTQDTQFYDRLAYDIGSDQNALDSRLLGLLLS